jgi:hypothetical protein
LATVVGGMSVLGSNVAALFALVLLTRGLGQSALSVASITAVGKGGQAGMAMGVYSILLSTMFMAAFVGVGAMVQSGGWRLAWAALAIFLAAGVAPVVARFLKNPTPPAAETENPATVAGLTLGQALRTPAFWIFSGAIALYALASSGLGLFNESVLGERGFDPQTAYQFLAVTAGVALIGQFLCGWAMQHVSAGRLLAISMLLYATGLATLPLLRTQTQLWVFAGIFGIAGGMVMVIFFAVWGTIFGRAHLGRIQGTAQMISVFASGLGPVLFAGCKERFGSYTPMLLATAALVVLFAFAAWRMKAQPQA